MNAEEADGVAVGDVIEAVDDADPATVRDALEPVTHDGVVTREAVETAVSDAAKLLATAETRIELAGDAYDDAAAAAAPVTDVPAVGTRIDALRDRLADVEAMIPALRPDLSIPENVRRRPVAAHQLAVEIREVVATAREAIEAADDLSFDAEQFESWLDRPNRRYDTFEEDVELVADTADDLAAAVDALPGGAADPAAQWAAATMRVRVLSLLVADLREELGDLRVLAERNGDPFRDGLTERLDGVDDRVAEVESALDALAEPAWRDRFGDDLAALDGDLAGIDPPVDWGTVDRLLEDHRPDVTTEEQ